MSSFFKKALGVFVELDTTPSDSETPESKTTQFIPQATAPHTSPLPPIRSDISSEDVHKFESHFSNLFDKANLPGPDYFEFCKMMETLEAHIPDERARMAAVFATLNIQGMTKEKLLESAAVYADIVAKDKSQFDQAVANKNHAEIESRQKNIHDLEEKIKQHAEQIQRMTQEISQYQTTIAQLGKEAAQEQQKIEIKNASYRIASQAMASRIQSDIQKIQSNL